MKQTIKIDENTVEVDGRIYKAEPVEDDWPKEDDRYWYISVGGGIGRCSWSMVSIIDQQRKAFHNCFDTLEQAECAATLRVLPNALTAAKAIVEPDWEPDWSDKKQAKYTPLYEHSWKVWATTTNWTANYGVPAYSTEEKAQEAIELLKKWGVMS